MDRIAEPVQFLRVAALCCLYISASSCLIRFNSHLMKPERFPFAMALTSIHMFSSFLFCSVLLWLRPSLFPGLEQTKGRMVEMLRWFAPVGGAFAVTLFASNSAYRYSSVSFLQFMKEANLIITFAISIAVGLQSATRMKVVVILWVIVGSTLSVGGEVNFVLLGFIFQALSQVAECSRHVLGDYIMNRASIKLDPLTYVLFSAPSCLCFLMLGNAFTWDPAIPGKVLENWWILAPNAVLAALLNVIVATTIKEISAVGFILCGVVKDVMLVAVSNVFFHEVVSSIQVAGFSLALSGVFFWSLMKTQPEHNAVVQLSLLLGSSEAAAETKGRRQQVRQQDEESDSEEPREDSPLIK